jgi:C_GCAxxG_C_C family probable redox protein
MIMMKASLDICIKRALDFHHQHYNCCQSVIMAMAEFTDVDPNILFRAAEGFGKGMGGMKGVCGALSGGVMFCGLQNSNVDLESASSKHATQEMAARLTETFRYNVGSIICRDIRGADSGKKLCSCDDCIVLMVRLLYNSFVSN